MFIRRITGGETYRDLDSDYFAYREPERQSERLISRLERLDHTITLDAAHPAPARFSSRPKCNPAGL
jgi:hypothetical protein